MRNRKETMTPGMIRSRIESMRAEIDALIARTTARMGVDQLCHETGTIITAGV
ncbi:MAG: hypothetical protein JW885_02495 [Deltaproteobacteria bacterium]|nr:hypothetical protein [Candidatus Zymogenaceae bacterium]